MGLGLLKANAIEIKLDFWIAVSPEALFAESLEDLCGTGHLRMAMPWLRELREVATGKYHNESQSIRNGITWCQ